MNLLRIILILLAIWLIAGVVRRMLRQRNGQSRRRSRELDAHSMVRCAHCGLHIPETEALRDGELFFCSTEHRLENQRAR